MDIKVYKKLFLLETYCGKWYLIEQSKVLLLDKLVESNKFIEIHGARINVSNISSYIPVPSSDIYDFVIMLPDLAMGVAMKILRDQEKKGHMPNLREFLAMFKERMGLRVFTKSTKDDILKILELLRVNLGSKDNGGN